MLFSNKKSNPVEYADDLLRNLYPIDESLTIKTLSKYIRELKECLKSFLPISHFNRKILNNLLEERFIHHSGAIDGNTASVSGVHSILRKNEVVTGLSLNEHVEILNHKEAFDYFKDCLKNKISLSTDVFLNAHYLILKTTNTKEAGIFRNSDIEIYGSKFTPPKPDKIEEHLYRYIQFYNIHKNKKNVITLASEMHGRFCFIKPFSTGNGILARMIMNYIFMQNGYPLVSISGTREGRLEYFHALEDLHTNPEVFYKFIMRNIAKSLSHYIKNVIPLAPLDKGQYFYDKIIHKFGIQAKERLFSMLTV